MRAGFSASPPLKQVQERKTCPPPEPPPPEPQDNRLKVGLFLLAVITGYCTVHAKKSPEVRDWLSIHMPWFDDWVAIAYQENMTYQEFVKKCIADLQDYWTDRRRPRQCSTDANPVPCDPPKERPRIECVPEEPKEGGQDGTKPCGALPPSVFTKNICELEEYLRERGETVINNYMTARDACRIYNKTVEDTFENFSLQRLNSLDAAMKERQELVNEHATTGDEAAAVLNHLGKYIDCGLKAPKEDLMKIKLVFSNFQAKINSVHTEYLWEQDQASVMDARWQQVKSIVDQYTTENESLFPSVHYDSTKPHIHDDVDLLLIHSLRYERKLRQILEDVAEGATERANRGVETALPPPKDDKEKRARTQAIQTAFRKRQAELDKSYRKKLDELKAHNDKVLQDALKAQKDRHEENMEMMLKQKEEEATIVLNQMVEDAVAAQKNIFARDLADMAQKLKVVEDKLAERLKADRDARRSQELWAAGASLLAATKKGEPRIRLDEELKALEKAAGDDDKLVKTVLKSISDDVRRKGLVPESVLRKRYHDMERTALRVALVEEEGGPMPVYIMSYVQSLLLFMKLSGIPKKDIDKPFREDLDELDTFDTLQRARYWVEKGNMAAALRYVASLEGASRVAAATWHDDARAHLEVRQAAEAVLAHAAALGLQYV